MKTLTMISAAWLILAAASWTQEAPKPGPDHKKLDVFAGAWTLDGEIKAGPMGPGGKVTEYERCEWMDGGFFLVCHTDFKSSMGNGSGMSLMGYSADDKAYTYREFNSWGEFTDSRGSLDGDTWIWVNDERIHDEKMGTTVMKAKFTMKVTSPTSYNFTFEMSPDGAKWTTVMDGKATKK